MIGSRRILLTVAESRFWTGHECDDCIQVAYHWQRCCCHNTWWWHWERSSRSQQELCMFRQQNCSFCPTDTHTHTRRNLPSLVELLLRAFHFCAAVVISVGERHQIYVKVHFGNPRGQYWSGKIVQSVTESGSHCCSFILWIGVISLHTDVLL